MTQHEASAKAGLSLATWRRVEAGQGSFRRSTVDAVERALSGGRGRPDSNTDAWIQTLARSFHGAPLTPRQAFCLAMTTDGHEDDAYLGWDDFLQGRTTVDTLGMLAGLPDWVLFMVNSVWLDRFRNVLVDLGDRVTEGETPSPSCFAESVALFLMLQEARRLVDQGYFDDLYGDDHVASSLPHLDRWSDEDEGVASATPDVGERTHISGCQCDELDGDAWGELEDDLRVFEAGAIWYPHVTRGLNTEPGLGTMHPFRWWEPLAHRA